MSSAVGKGMAGAGLEEKGTAAMVPAKQSARTLLQGHLNSHYLRSRCHWMLLLLWVSCWSLFSLWIFSSASSQAVEMRRAALADMCDERARMLEQQINGSMNHLQAVAILISTFHHMRNPSGIDQATFARYAERTAFERPLTRGLAYAVRVTHDERELFERRQAWSIKMMNSSSERSPAEEYAPVVFAEDAFKHVISFDMLLEKEDRENVLRARESGKGVLSAPSRMLNNRLGVVLTYAVYKSELPPNATAQDRTQSAIGYLGCIFDMEAHVDKLLQRLADKQSIMVNVYDTTKGPPVSLYGTNDTGSSMCHLSKLNLGDASRKHEMHCRFMQRPPLPWLAITSSCGTLLVSLLVGYRFHFAAKWIAKVKGADVIQGTHEQEEVAYLNLRFEVLDKLKETSSKFIAKVSHCSITAWA